MEVVIDRILGVFLGYIFYAIPLFFLVSFLIAFLKSSWLKGKMGEVAVNLGAKLFLNKNKYHLLKNVTLPTKNGTTQIDHIIVSDFGVFVIETKNIKGWIYGSSDQSVWTQKLFKKSHKFQNPLHQNSGHVRALQALLKLRDHQVHSVVVFVGESKFKTKMPPNVTKGGRYIRYIKSKKEEVINASDVPRFVNIIEQERLAANFKTDRAHVKHVKKVVANKGFNAVPSCPKCNFSMVLRKTSKGVNAGNEFYGCSKFPHCRGIVKYV